MLKDQNIICFGFAEWDNPYKTNQHHLMERLAERNRVLFIESLGLRQPVLQKRDIKRIIKRICKWFGGVKNISETIYVFSPLVLPFHKFLPVRVFNRMILSLQLNYVVSAYNFKEPIIWSYVPNAVEFLGKWHEKLSVYHCVDELTANPRVPADAVGRMEEKYLKRADLVFVTSKPLYAAKKKFTNKVYYMPNVADFDHFRLAGSESTAQNEEMNNIQKPILGFIGAVSEYKLDFELLAYLASGHPEWSIVLIGATGEGEKQADLSKISIFKNVHVLGGRDYKDLPSYIKAFNVCLLPSKLNDYTRNMFPMKFFEYLASGKPVVSTRLESLADFGNLAYFSKDRQEFENNIKIALSESGGSLKSERIKMAAGFTWQNRIEEMSEVIEGALK